MNDGRTGRSVVVERIRSRHFLTAISTVLAREIHPVHRELLTELGVRNQSKSAGNAPPTFAISP